MTAVHPVPSCSLMDLSGRIRHLKHEVDKLSTAFELDRTAGHTLIVSGDSVLLLLTVKQLN